MGSSPISGTTDNASPALFFIAFLNISIYNKKIKESVLELRKITKVYHTGNFEQKALAGVSLSFRKSEFASILGPSGSGKTTLLNIIGGLDSYTSGDLLVGDISTKKYSAADWDSYRNHRIGFVFQSYNLIPHQTILSNVRLALTVSGISKREGVKRAKAALSAVGLSEHIHKRPAQLSGGQMQRVAIARALVNDPDIVLADEPTGALDSETSIQIMKILKDISKTRLVIMVTHNPDLAQKYSTRIINLKDGQIISDSNPATRKDAAKEPAAVRKQKHGKTSMSMFTAFALSGNNLLTKKKRTLLVSIAASIGIIGIALIMAVSTGFQNYIDDIQEDTLTSYPLNIMEESFSLSELLIAPTSESSSSSLLETSGKDVVEYQFLANTLRSVATNDLKSFKAHLETNSAQYQNDVTSLEYHYSVDPLIYTIDGSNTLAKLNPSNLFASMFGGSQLLSSYSSYASIFSQISDDREALETQYELKAGHWPENYDEMVLVLTSEHAITDLLAYSIGLKDTAELSTMVTKLMSGESVDVQSEPLALNYEDFLNLDLRLILPFDLYKYNEKYKVYEDMSGNDAFVQQAYDHAIRLKISGVVYPKSGSMSAMLEPGVGYTSALIDFIINSAKDTEIVQKQLADPDTDVFSGARFDQKNDRFNYGFEDLVTVDEAKLQSAFNITIDQTALQNSVTDQIADIVNNISVDTTPALTAFDDTLNFLTDGFRDYLTHLVIEAMAQGNYTFNPMDKIDEHLDNYLNTYEPGERLSALETTYKIPKDNFKSVYKGLALAVIAGADLDSAEILVVREGFASLMTEAKLKVETAEKVANVVTTVSDAFAQSFNLDPSAITSAFKLNFTEDELMRIVSSMLNKTDSTAKSNLLKLGYQDRDDPSYISAYFSSFDGKENFIQFIKDYNTAVEAAGEKDKVINFADTTGILMNSVKIIVDAVSYVLIAFVSISLVVSSIMIGVITYISVFERTKEIGILRAIGASKRNISSIFNAETAIIGLLSGLIGIAISYLFIPLINAVLSYFTGDVSISANLPSFNATCLVLLSIILTLIGGFIPARSAAKKDPVEALRTE